MEQLITNIVAFAIPLLLSLGAAVIVVQGQRKKRVKKVVRV